MGKLAMEGHVDGWAFKRPNGDRAKASDYRYDIFTKLEKLMVAEVDRDQLMAAEAERDQLMAAEVERGQLMVAEAERGMEMAEEAKSV